MTWLQLAMIIRLLEKLNLLDQTTKMTWKRTSGCLQKRKFICEMIFLSVAVGVVWSLMLLPIIFWHLPVNVQTVSRLDLVVATIISKLKLQQH